MTAEEIRALQRRCAVLVPDAQTRQTMTAAATRHAEGFIETLADAPAYRASSADDIAVLDEPFSEAPTEFESLLGIIRTAVDLPGVNTTAGGHLGYVPGGGLHASSLGDLLAATSNRYAGVAFASPGGARMEERLVDWLASVVGFPDTAAGDLASGGSIANLIGIVTARDAHGLAGGALPEHPIYVSSQTHHCVDKALRIAGLATCPRRVVATDARHRMDAGALRAAVEADRRAGLRPWLVIGSSGTTDAGAIDPLADIADIAETFGLWLHVDAAYGGFFMLVESAAARMSGIERADSLVMDPHKGMFLPYGTGALLVRQADALLSSQHYDANYMREAKQGSRQVSPSDLSPELSRHFRGLRMWLPLKLAGVAAFRAALEEKLLLAQYFHQHIGEAEGFERGPSPDLSIATYRYVPKRGDADQFNLKLVEAMLADGRVFVTSTKLDGKVTLRACALCVRTHLEHIELAIDLLRFHAKRLVNGAA